MIDFYNDDNDNGHTDYCGSISSLLTILSIYTVW